MGSTSLLCAFCAFGGNGKSLLAATPAPAQHDYRAVNGVTYDVQLLKTWEALNATLKDKTLVGPRPLPRWQFFAIPGPRVPGTSLPLFHTTKTTTSTALAPAYSRNNQGNTIRSGTRSVTSTSTADVFWLVRNLGNVGASGGDYAYLSGQTESVTVNGRQVRAQVADYGVRK